MKKQYVEGVQNKKNIDSIIVGNIALRLYCFQAESDNVFTVQRTETKSDR